VEPARAGGAPTDIGRKRAVIKIQDGCSFHCTYCIIPRARGSERSVSADTVVAEALRAVAAGHREVVLTGINAGTYCAAGPPAGAAAAAALGAASGAASNLAALVRRLLAETGVERIRLSSIEPQHVTEELLAVWADSRGRCQPHFHIPLQSGDDAILRRMGRRYDTVAYADVIARVRRAIPGAAVHTDVIVGFPGEDDASFERMACFLRALEPAGVHVFRFSARPGTPASRMIGRVDERTVARRAAELLSLAADARATFAAALLGGELRVLFEQPLADGRWLGHDEHHVEIVAPSPDGRPLTNRIDLVRAESIEPGFPSRIVGRVVSVP
jgi:threonylcarbamoyladenosine tRNA methylthiotransferase MtaB